VTEDAISIGGVDLTDPDTFAKGMPYEAFRELRQRAPVAWHPFKDGPGFLALTGYDEVLAVSATAPRGHHRRPASSTTFRCPRTPTSSR